MADIILVFHFAFVVFVIGGQFLFMLGYHCRWSWATRRPSRFVHLGCVVFLVLQAWAGRWCPLTVLENKYRAAAGAPVYERSFIQHWVGRALYYEAPLWVFTLAYTAFGVLAVTYWILIERRTARESARAG